MPPETSPFSVANPAAISGLRSALGGANYTESAICDLLATSEIPGPRQRLTQHQSFLDRTKSSTPLATLVRLFLLNESVSIDAARQALAPLAESDWPAMTFLEITPAGVRSGVELMPLDGLLLAADWLDSPASEPVMGVASTSQLLAQLTVRRPVRHALDIGTGCGVLALLAARHCERVTATELNPRAIQCAEFNSRLNGVTNVEFIVGDRLEPVHGREFDLIVCNPPFVIGPRGGHLHTQSGQSADGFLHDMIRTAPAHLRRDGYLQIVGDWVQLANETWRDRITSWFQGSGCDAWVLHSEVDSPENYATRRIRDTELRSNMIDEWMAYYRQEQINGIVSGAIAMRRSMRQPNWVRFSRFPGVAGPAGPAIERGFALRDFLDDQDDSRLLTTTLHRAEQLRAERQNANTNLRLTDGLCFATDVDQNVAQFVANCDGRLTLRAILGDLATKAGRRPDQIPKGALQVVRRLVEGGFLIPAEVIVG